MRRDGSSAAKVQPEHRVDERGDVHGASELETTQRQRASANGIVDLHRYEENEDGKRTSKTRRIRSSAVMGGSASEAKTPVESSPHPKPGRERVR